jgi:DNA-binding NtrC family response regulator
MQVLIIDDEASIRNSMSEFFDDFGFAVTTVGSAEAALRSLKENHFDVAIVDIRLPGIDGDALITEAHEIIPSMRFIIHTGSVEYHLSEALRSIGLRNKHIFIKPVADLNALAKAVQRIVAQDRQETP